jgi:hypothetical protein
MRLWEWLFGGKRVPLEPEDEAAPCCQPKRKDPVLDREGRRCPAQLSDPKKLKRLGPAAVEPLLRALDDPEGGEKASCLLAQIPAADAVEPLLHLLGIEQLRGPAKRVLFGLDKAVVLEALGVLLGQLAAGAPAFALARRCLDHLWPEARDFLIQIADSGARAAPLAQRYLGFKDPPALQDRVRAQYRFRDSVVRHLPQCGSFKEVIQQLLDEHGLREAFRGRDDEEVRRHFHPSLVVGCLSAGEAAADKVRWLDHDTDTLRHAVQALALPESRANAVCFLEGAWAEQPRRLIGLWSRQTERAAPWFNGLLDNFLQSRGPTGYGRMAALLDESFLRDTAAGCLTWAGREAIPALAQVASRPGFSRGVLGAVDSVLAEVVDAILAEPALRKDGLNCLRAAEFAVNELTGPVQELIAAPEFDGRDWPACLRRDRAALDAFPLSLSLVQALHLCARWDVLPQWEQQDFLKRCRDRIVRMLNLQEHAYQRQLADVHLSAQRVVAEPRGRWYINSPPAAEDIARQLTPESRGWLRQAKYFLSYVCQARVCGDLKDFATEMLALIP